MHSNGQFKILIPFLFKQQIKIPTIFNIFISAVFGYPHFARFSLKTSTNNHLVVFIYVIYSITVIII